MSGINLSSFIWSVADLLRDDYKQSEYGKVILPFRPPGKKPPGLQKRFPSRAHWRNGTGFIRHSRSRNTLQRPLVLAAPRLKRLSFFLTTNGETAVHDRM
jgi:hypothetical protein